MAARGDLGGRGQKVIVVVMITAVTGAEQVFCGGNPKCCAFIVITAFVQKGVNCGTQILIHLPGAQLVLDLELEPPQDLGLGSAFCNQQLRSIYRGPCALEHLSTHAVLFALFRRALYCHLTGEEADSREISSSPRSLNGAKV